MDVQIYREQALRSEKPLEAVVGDKDLVLRTMQLAEAAGNVVDLLKKNVVYGREMNYQAFHDAVSDVVDHSVELCRLSNTPPVAVDVVPVNPRVFHATVGIFGEAGELFAALLHQAHTGHLDVKNLEEEGGDTSWYVLALLVDAIVEAGGVDGATMLRMNLAKLAKRFPELFSLEASEARDVGAEAAAMEAARAA